MKLQISAIFEGAYKFLFANVLTIIGIAWLPYLIAIAVSGLAIFGMVPSQFWHGDFSNMNEADVWMMIPKIAGLWLVMMFVWIVMSAMVTVAIQRRALGLTHGAVFAYFSLDETVWRLIGASFLLLLAIMAIAVGFAVSCTLIVLAANALLSQGFAVFIAVVLCIAAYCAFIYTIVRWSFFIAPVVVAEGHIGLARAWHLGHGNFWRIFAIIIVVYLPISMAGGMLSQIFIAVFGGVNALNDLPQHPSDAQVWAMLHQVLFAFLPAVGISTLIQMIALAGVSNGAQALAYRQMSGTQPPAN